MACLADARNLDCSCAESTIDTFTSKSGMLPVVHSDLSLKSVATIDHTLCLVLNHRRRVRRVQACRNHAPELSDELQRTLQSVGWPALGRETEDFYFEILMLWNAGVGSMASRRTSTSMACWLTVQRAVSALRPPEPDVVAAVAAWRGPGEAGCPRMAVGALKAVSERVKGRFRAADVAELKRADRRQRRLHAWPPFHALQEHLAENAGALEAQDVATALRACGDIYEDLPALLPRKPREQQARVLGLVHALASAIADGGPDSFEKLEHVSTVHSLRMFEFRILGFTESETSSSCE